MYADVVLCVGASMCAPSVYAFVNVCMCVCVRVCVCVCLRSIVYAVQCRHQVEASGVGTMAILTIGSVGSCAAVPTIRRAPTTHTRKVS